MRLLLVLAVASTSGALIDLTGNCARLTSSRITRRDKEYVVSQATTDGMEALANEVRWIYRIAVKPWRVFGAVEVTISGHDISIDEEVRCAKLLEDDSNQVLLELKDCGAKPEIVLSGRGIPMGDPVLGPCHDLERIESSCRVRHVRLCHTTCPLAARLCAPHTTRAFARRAPSASCAACMCVRATFA